MNLLLLILFVIGYAAIAAEHSIKINKAATALITGVLCWTVYISFSADRELVSEELTGHLGELSGILFFLLGAMTIVELIDAHDGFNIITDRIKQRGKLKLLWIVSFITFFLSPLLDNLTTTIVMISLVRKLVQSHEDRLFFAGMIVIAANAGGAWSPIGDVTTTMLWIGGQITAAKVILNLFLPSLVCIVVPLLFLGKRVKGKVESPPAQDMNTNERTYSKKQQAIVFFSGVIILILVPVFKTITHLPPYMGILIGLGILWLITEILHGAKPDNERHHLSVSRALQRVDSPSILFFLGILLCVAALQSAGLLSTAAEFLSDKLKTDNMIVISFGLLSAIIDNVPLVAAAQGMYPLEQYPTDHNFWIFLAYTTGTGGSALIIGTAAGVAAMGIEKISFGWYLKKISLLAVLGFLAGAVVYILQQQLFT